MDGMPLSGSQSSGPGFSSSQGASLRSLLGNARFIHADDVWAERCCNRPEVCEPGDVYVMSPLEEDTEAAAAKAVARGVRGIVTERLLPFTTPQCLIGDARWAYAKLCDALAGSPGKRLFTIGVVGGHGKTTAVVAIAHMLRQLGIRVAYRCDLGASDGVAQGLPVEPSLDAQGLTDWLLEACDANASAAVVELNASMLEEQHATPLHPDLLIVTDGDDMQSVKRAAELLSAGGVLVANGDSVRLQRWLDQCDLGVLRYGLQCDGDVGGMIFRREPGEMTLLVTAGDTTAALQTKLTGRLHALAQLAAVSVGLLTGAALHQCLDGLQRLTRIPGRCHRLPSLCGPAFFLDAADRATRAEAALKALRGEIRGATTAVVMLPAHATPAERAMLARAAEKNARSIILTVAPSGKKQFMPWVHDALDGVERPEKVRWIASWQQALRTAHDGAKERDCVVVLCPRGNASVEAHRALLESIAERVQQLQGAVTLPHPGLLAAS